LQPDPYSWKFPVKLDIELDLSYHKVLKQIRIKFIKSMSCGITGTCQLDAGFKLKWTY
jgi:hypothetical protein